MLSLLLLPLVISGGAAVVTNEQGKAQMDGILAALRAAVDSPLPLDVYQVRCC